MRTSSRPLNRRRRPEISWQKRQSATVFRPRSDTAAASRKLAMPSTTTRPSKSPDALPPRPPTGLRANFRVARDSGARLREQWMTLLPQVDLGVGRALSLFSQSVSPVLRLAAISTESGLWYVIIDRPMFNWNKARRVWKQLNPYFPPDTTRILTTAQSTAVILALGAVLSHSERDWTMFARAGCLVTVIALRSTLGRIRRQTTLNGWRQDLAGSNLSASDRARLERLVATVQTRIHLEAPITKVTEAVEIVALILGTLAWGFGDLFGKLYSK